MFLETEPTSVIRKYYRPVQTGITEGGFGIGQTFCGKGVGVELPTPAHTCSLNHHCD